MEQHFEEMEVVKFRWLFEDTRVSLKEACKTKAVVWIVVAVLILIFGAGGSFLLAAIRSHNITYHGLQEEVFALEMGIESLVEGLVLFFLGLPENAFAIAVGVGSLVEGLLLLIYSIVLLNKLEDTGAAGVFQTIKVACLIVLYLRLIKSFVFCLIFMVLLMPLHLARFPISQTGKICGLVGSVLRLLLTTLFIYAVHSVKPKIVCVFICIEGISLVISSFFLGYFFTTFFPALIIKFILLVVVKAVTLGLFALHVNMMTITIATAPPSKNQLQLIDLF